MIQDNETFAGQEAWLAGVELCKAGKPQDALPLLLRAHEESPSELKPIHSIAICYRQLRLFAKALEWMLQLEAFLSDQAEYWHFLGQQWDMLGESTDALACYHRAAEITPSPSILSDMGVTLQKAGDFKQASVAFRKALAMDDSLFETWNNLGVCCRSSGDLDRALECFRRSLDLRPDSPDTLNNIGNILRSSGDPAAAVEHYQRALDGRPAYPEARNNLAIALNMNGDPIEAMRQFDKTLEACPDYLDARLNRALLLLETGDWQKGWEEFESRRPKDWTVDRRDYGVPWKGELMPGRRLLLKHEQGLGDTIQFVRFAAMAKAASQATIVLDCQPALRQLLATFPFVDEILDNPTDVDTHWVAQQVPSLLTDAYLPLMSLPHTLFRNDPSSLFDHVDESYLGVPEDLVSQWRGKVAQQGLRVGLAWQGNAQYDGDGLRSIPSQEFSRLKSLEGVTWYCLQHEPTADDLESIDFPITQFQGMDTTSGRFMDTAAIIRNLDLVITSDSAVAHLSGALGQRTWLLLNAAPDWRWGKEGTRSPWYPTMRLFRQKQLGQWDQVLEQVRHELQQL